MVVGTSYLQKIAPEHRKLEEKIHLDYIIKLLMRMQVRYTKFESKSIKISEQKIIPIFNCIMVSKALVLLEKICILNYKFSLGCV